MIRIVLVKRLSADLIGLTTDGDAALWTVAVVRKAYRCAVCQRFIHPGDCAFRPAGNQSYRYLRVHTSHFVPPEPAP